LLTHLKINAPLFFLLEVFLCFCVKKKKLNKTNKNKGKENRKRDEENEENKTEKGSNPNLLLLGSHES